MHFRFCVSILERSMLFRPFFFCLLLGLLGSCAIGHRSKHSTPKPKVKISNSKRDILEKYSAIVGVELYNAELYAFIDEWYATPHCIGGKSKQCIDCSGFSAVLYQKLYHKEIQGSSASIFTQCKPVRQKDVVEGDFVFFKINQNKVSHVGIYLGNHRFVHASTTRGVMISSLEENYYKKWFEGFGRLK